MGTVTSPPPETDFFSLHQSFAFPCVWAPIIHGTGVPAPPPCKTTSVGGEKKRMPQEESGKAATQ